MTKATPRFLETIVFSEQAEQEFEETGLFLSSTERAERVFDGQPLPKAEALTGAAAEKVRRRP